MRNMEQIQSIDTSDIIEKTMFHIKNVNLDKVVLLPLSIKENQTVREWAKAAPEIFIPFFNPPEKPMGDESIEQVLEHAITEQGYRGFKVMLPFRRKFLDDKILYPVLELAQQQDVPVLMHTGYPPPKTRRPVLSYANPVKIDEFIDSFPSLNLILAHMGYPWVDVAISLAVQYRNVHLDISNLTYMMPNKLKEFLLRAKEIIGVDKILFGSDGFVPEMIEMAVNYFASVDFLTDREIKTILGLNAEKILKF